MMEYVYSGFRIRPARDTDLDTVINLWQQQPDLLLGVDDSPQTLQELLAAGKLHLYVADCGPDIVGTVLAGADGRRGHLYHVVVAEPHRGLGLGRTLIDIAVDELVSRGLARTHVFVQIDSERARAFWTHLGWLQRTDLTVYSCVAKESLHAD